MAAPEPTKRQGTFERTGRSMGLSLMGTQPQVDGMPTREPITPATSVDMMKDGGDMRINSAYDLQAQRAGSSKQDSQRVRQETARDPSRQIKRSLSSAPSATPDATNPAAAGQESRRQLASQDPAYVNRAAIKDKMEQTTTQVATAAADIGVEALAKATDKYWNGLWGTIPPIITGVGIFAFIGATCASWLSLGRTLFSGLTDKFLGKATRLLPPKMGPTLSGLSMAGFFVTAHTLWLLFFVTLAGVIVITILPYALPFFAAETIIETVTGG